MPYYGEYTKPEIPSGANAYCPECGEPFRSAPIFDMGRRQPEHIMCDDCLDRVNARAAWFLKDIDVERIYKEGLGA